VDAILDLGFTTAFLRHCALILILGLVNAASFIIVPIYMITQARCRIDALTPIISWEGKCSFNLIVLEKRAHEPGGDWFLLEFWVPPLLFLSVLPQMVLAVVLLKRGKAHMEDVFANS